MVELNLLPDIKKEFIQSQKNKRFVIGVSILVTIGAVAITLLLALYVFGVQNGLIFLETRAISDASKEIDKDKDNINKYLTVQHQLESLPALHEDKAIYSRLLTFLPTLNPGPPNNITLTSLEVNAEERTITFNGNSKTFTAFNTFNDTLKNAKAKYKIGSGDAAEDQEVRMFEQVATDTTSLGRSGNETVVNFTIRVVYHEDVFNAKSSGVNAVVPSETTTPSVNSAPKPNQLFDGNVQQQGL